jgi:hypothetical protein
MTQRQEKSTAFRFHGLRKSRENCISVDSFFLSNHKRRACDLFFAASKVLR